MKLPKIPIDYSKAGTGEAPFDGREYFLHDRRFVFVVQGRFKRYECADEYGYWRVGDRGHELTSDITHYTPMPEFGECEPLSDCELKKQIALDVVNEILANIDSHCESLQQSPECATTDFLNGFDCAYKRIKKIIDSEMSIFSSENLKGCE